MKKNDSKGFMLAETLVVTAFVAGVLIFLFIQFSRLSNMYNEYYSYNTTESLYALDDIKDYIISDATAYNYISTNISTDKYIDISDCSSEIFSDTDYCETLFNLENISKIYVFDNTLDFKQLDIADEVLKNFISKINNKGTEPYRLVALFNNSSLATIRFN